MLMINASKSVRLDRNKGVRFVRPLYGSLELVACVEKGRQYMERSHQRLGQNVLITGAAGGIGQELARCFARDGYTLVLTSRDEARLEVLAKQIRAEFDAQVHVIASDVANDEGVNHLIRETDRLGLDIDVLVNNAGYGLVGLLHEADVQDQIAMLHVNTMALTVLTTHYWPGMLRRGRGGLLNVSSGAAFQPCPFMAVYAAAKAYTLSVTEALWEEARGTGVHVTCLCPGPTESGFHSRSGTDASAVGKGPMQTAQEVAELGYAALLANKRVIVPGFGNRVKALMGVLLPNGFILKNVRKVFT